MVSIYKNEYIVEYWSFIYRFEILLKALNQKRVREQRNLERKIVSRERKRERDSECLINFQSYERYLQINPHESGLKGICGRAVLN